MFPRKTWDRRETQMWLLRVTMETEKDVIEKFLEDQKSHITPKQSRLLGTTTKTTTLSQGTCFRCKMQIRHTVNSSASSSNLSHGIPFTFLTSVMQLLSPATQTWLVHLCKCRQRFPLSGTDCPFSRYGKWKHSTFCGLFCFLLCSYNYKVKQPFFKGLYMRSSLVSCNQLEEAEEPKTELIQVDSSCLEDDTYRVGLRESEKWMSVILVSVTASSRKIVHVLMSKASCAFLLVWWKLVHFPFLDSRFPVMLFL